MKRSSEHGQFLPLVLAFALTSFAFIAASAFVQARALSIDHEVEGVIANAVPSIAHLASARTALRHIEVASDAFAEGDENGRLAQRAKLDAARNELNEQLATYLQLPSFDGERALYNDVPKKIAAVDFGITQLYRFVGEGKFDEARRTVDGDLRSTIDLLDSRLCALEAFNGSSANHSATNILSIRQSTLTVTIILDAVCVVLAAVAALFVALAARRYSRLAEDHRRMLADRAEELEQFARRVAHDLLSPLTALAFLLQSMKRLTASDAEAQEVLVRAKGCLKRSETMVGAIFEFARSGARPPQGGRASVRAAATDVVDELTLSNASPRAKIHVDSFEECDVACAPGVLGVILSNLVNNAAKYMKDCVEQRIVVRARRAGERIRIEIDDTGPGVPPGLEERIFQPYVRGPESAQAGLGLGLATVRRLTEAHGGAVGVVSKGAEAGSIFWVELPEAPAQNRDSVVQVRVRNPMSA